MPRLYQSGEISRSGRISKCGDAMVRSLLFEAALSLHRMWVDGTDVPMGQGRRSRRLSTRKKEGI
jgi:hypothetical protein